MLELSASAIKAHQLDTDKIHNDSTTITFKGRYENQAMEAVQLRCGHNKDFRRTACNSYTDSISPMTAIYL